MDTSKKEELDLSTRIVNVTDELSNFINNEFADFSSYFNDKLQEMTIYNRLH